MSAAPRHQVRKRRGMTSSANEANQQPGLPGDHLLESFLERSPVAHWIEDFSALMPWLETLRSTGVSDLRSYFDDHPEQVGTGIDLIRIVDVNPAGLSLIGATDKDRVIKQGLGGTATTESRQAFIEQILAAWEGRANLRTVGSGRTVDGRLIDYVLTWVVAVGDGPHLSTVIVSVEDITGLKAAQRQIAHLVQANERFLAAVTHELRTPLTGVLGFAELLMESGPASSEEANEYTDFLACAASAGGAVLENLMLALDLEKDGSGFATPIQLVQTPVDLPTVAHAVVASLPPGAREQIEVEAVPLAAHADSVRVRQIMRNLLANATDHGGDTIRLHIHNSNERAHVVVTDNGPGLPPQASERAFELFSSFDQDPNLPGPLGIGLTVSRALARAMGGDLHYDRSGDSTTFTLLLPLADVDLQ